MLASGSTVDVDARIDAALAQGDPAAVRLMVDHYAPGLRHWLLEKQGRWLVHADIEDIVQEALKYVWERRASFDADIGRVKTLLFETARRRTIDRFRARRREGEKLTGGDGEARAVACRARSPLLVAIDSEAIEAVRSLLPELSEFERDALMASRRSPRGYAVALAERYGKDAGAVRAATDRALKKLRKRLKEEGHDVA